MSIYMGSNVAQCVSFSMAMAMMVLLNLNSYTSLIPHKEKRIIARALNSYNTNTTKIFLISFIVKRVFFFA